MLTMKTTTTTTTILAVISDNSSIDLDYNDSMSSTSDENSFELSFEFRIILTSLYIIVFICSFFGNLLVLLLFTRYKSLRTMTNFFLANLAVADFMVSIFCVIPQMLRSIYFISINLTICRLNSYVQAVCFTASIQTLVLISLERYVAIVHPIRAREWITFKRLKILAATIWLFSTIYNLPYILFHRFTIIELADYSLRFCYIPKWSLLFVDDKTYQLFSIIIFYLIPLLLMLTVYSKIIIAIFRRYKEINKMNMNNSETIALTSSIDIDFKPILSRPSSARAKTRTVMMKTPKIQINGNSLEGEENCIKMKKPYLGTVPIRANSICSVASNDSNDTVYSRTMGSFKNILRNGSNSSKNKKILIDRINNEYSPNNQKPYLRYLKIKESFLKSPSERRLRRNAITSKPRSTISTSSSGGAPSKLVLESRKRIVKLLIVLLCCFAFNVLPYQLQVIITKFGYLEEYQNTKEFKFFVIFSFILYYANAGVNCFIYFILSNRFRKYILRTVSSCKRCSRCDVEAAAASNNKTLTRIDV